MSTLLNDAGLSTALGITLKASALLGLAAAAQYVVRRRASAATRHFLWLLAVLSVVVLPAVTLAIPQWSVGIRVPRAAAPNPARLNPPPASAEATNAASVAAVRVESP